MVVVGATVVGGGGGAVVVVGGRVVVVVVGGVVVEVVVLVVTVVEVIDVDAIDVVVEAVSSGSVSDVVPPASEVTTNAPRKQPMIHIHDLARVDTTLPSQIKSHSRLLEACHLVGNTLVGHLSQREQENEEGMPTRSMPSHEI